MNKAKAKEASDVMGVCPNCEQWQRRPVGDCSNECARRGFAPFAPPAPTLVEVE